MRNCPNPTGGVTAPFFAFRLNMTAPHWCRRLLEDDRGQDLVEYALLAAIIGIAGSLVLPLIAPKMGAAFSSWGSQIYNEWRPAAPAP